MKNKVILITGALTGIGRATAIAFAREGAHVVVCGRHDDAGNALVTELRAVGAEAEYIRADVRHEDDVRGLVDRTVKRFGRLDVAVNNAGTEGKPGPVTEQTAESYASTFDTNVLGTRWTQLTARNNHNQHEQRRTNETHWQYNLRHWRRFRYRARAGRDAAPTWQSGNHLRPSQGPFG